ncbi:hypothetical protein Bbelb_125400 [Branchiostoma belcheri]|nr:hypothetical protein Bbelb_125400 [Branchiostoma belcheri]
MDPRLNITTVGLALVHILSYVFIPGSPLRNVDAMHVHVFSRNVELTFRGHLPCDRSSVTVHSATGRVAPSLGSGLFPGHTQVVSPAPGPTFSQRNYTTAPLSNSGSLGLACRLAMMEKGPGSCACYYTDR